MHQQTNNSSLYWYFSYTNTLSQFNWRTNCERRRSRW